MNDQGEILEAREAIADKVEAGLTAQTIGILAHVLGPLGPSCVVIREIVQEREEAWVVEQDVPQVEIPPWPVRQGIGAIGFSESAVIGILRSEDIQEFQESQPGGLFIVEAMSPDGFVDPHVGPTDSLALVEIRRFRQDRQKHSIASQAYFNGTAGHDAAAIKLQDSQVEYIATGLSDAVPLFC